MTSQKRSQAKLKAQCLARDNNRCILTGFYDSTMALEQLSDEERQSVYSMHTEAAHIIPFSLASFTERDVLDIPLHTILSSALGRSYQRFHQPDSFPY